MTGPTDAQQAEGQKGPSFWPMLHHKPIAVHLAGAPMISGELIAYSIYEIVIRTRAGRETLIPKHAIVSIDLNEGWRTLPNDQQEADNGQ